MADEPNPIKEKILKSLNSPIIEAANENAITPSRIFAKINQLLDFKTTKHFAFQGKVIETVDLEDGNIQIKAADLGASLLGMKTERLQVEGSLTNLSDEELQKRIDEYLEARQKDKPTDSKG